mmetsp:Transcript_16403/g.24810  ORF Transcript_16403/g.24810 Transcript_16403/m.24810 type:complete len:124 (+) Transcript_16403:86-457(+)|eukprot:CAMPEP_0178925380 /NCGR_PEP_ID=MMETSP0786-20121207/17880_1 /TAXON_ID=186022 /ORGANISM="Thalassionema frauenfeldii, Strain CCMP 1798" /LENGTH=123 /DNA_ID=CAMNT_0020600255 /DNA_START=211 /DNA_END=582 /DNA_ORIENTATION=-
MGLLQIHDFHATLVDVINDDVEFRKLKKEMRKHHRSGFAPQQAVYKLIMEENSRRNEMKENAMFMLQQSNMMENDTTLDRAKLMATLRKNSDGCLSPMDSKMRTVRTGKPTPPRKKIQTAACA